METEAGIETSKHVTAERIKIKEAAEVAAKEENGGEGFEDLSNHGWVHDYTRAIILAHVSKTAQNRNWQARADEGK